MDQNRARLISGWQATSGTEGEYLRFSGLVVNSRALVRDLGQLLLNK